MFLRKGAAARNLKTRRHWGLSAAVAALMLAAGGVHAADKLNYGPAEAWVRPAAQGALNPAQINAPLQMLLDDTQVHFGADGDETYTEVAVHIQTPAGLQGVQPIAVWNPDTDTVTVHKVQIVRGDQTIDLLKTLNFTVLRRETNLERAMLDGDLTAVMPPEGLQVGDTLVYAMTIRRQDPVLKGHSETILGSEASFPIAHTEIRAVWDASKSVRLRQSDDLPATKVAKTDSGSEYDLDLHNVTRGNPPVDAPARFSELGQIELSQFTGWDEVSALVQPLYVKAATLSPDSPLKAEAAKIKAASSDPKVQATMALHLVEDQVRYLFLGMNLGGYTPADADVTWQRRFGDCKGKTVLLLALLHELGIKAEPALISTTLGDGLDQRLPMLIWFDHVMVRAEIGGKVYWLDGTRLDDRDIDSLQVPDFGFALPLRPTGGALEPLKPLPLTQPSQEVLMTLDASAGLDVPAKAHFEAVFRGDDGIGAHQYIDGLSGPALDKAMRDYWSSFDFITVQKVSASFDAATGVEKLVMDGAARLEWKWDDATRTWRYETDDTRIGWAVDNARQPGLHSDAPFKIQYPIYFHNHESIILPKGGKGFAIDGDVVDKTLGGAEFKRTLAVHDGVMQIDASKRSLVPEISAVQNAADGPVLRAMYEKGVFLVAPEGYKSGAGQDVKLPGDTTRSAGDLVNEGGELLRQGKDDQALSRYNQALQLEPNNAEALLGRAQVFSRRKAFGAALADLAQALKSDPTQWRAWDLTALIYEQQDKYPEAVDAFTKALAIYPNDTFAMSQRAGLYGDMGDKDKARADAEATLQIDPANAEAVRVLALLTLQDKKRDEAKALVQKAIDANPDDVDLYDVMIMIDENCAGLTGAQCRAAKADAVAVYDKIIALKPTAESYAFRAQDRPLTDIQGKLDDLTMAIQLDPNDTTAYLVRAATYLYTKDYAKALADTNQAITLDPKDEQGYYIRAQVYLGLGKIDLGLADIDKLVADHPQSSGYLNESCWQRATHGVELDKALAACDAAVKLAPKNPAIIDSHGFVELRLGHYDEAIADYTAALALSPNLADSLYGRGIAKLHKGQTKEGQADLDAARKLEPKIDETWAGYGIKPS